MRVLTYFGAVSISLMGVSCVDTSAPIDTLSNYDPLDAPGQNSSLKVIQKPALGPTFSPGLFVEAIVPDVAFYSKKPKGVVDADKLLKKGTSMKVVSQSGNYTKVELDSGSVGFVNSLHIDEPRTKISSSAIDVTPGRQQPQQNFGIPDLPSSASSADDQIDFSDPIDTPKVKYEPPKLDSSKPPKKEDVQAKANNKVEEVLKDETGLPKVPNVSESTGPVDVTPTSPVTPSTPVEGIQVPDLPEPATE